MSPFFFFLVLFWFHSETNYVKFLPGYLKTQNYNYAKTVNRTDVLNDRYYFSRGKSTRFSRLLPTHGMIFYKGGCYDIGERN